MEINDFVGKKIGKKRNLINIKVLLGLSGNGKAPEASRLRSKRLKMEWRGGVCLLLVGNI